MSASTYLPVSTSVAGRVCAYFKANPEEQLSAADIALKFEAQASSVSALLHKCFETKLLKRVSTRGELIVGAGDRLVDTDLQASPATVPPGSAFAQAPKPRAQRRTLPPLDPSKLTVIAKAPPPKRTNGSTTDWNAIFSQLQVGQAIEDFPADYYGAVAKAAQSWAKTRRAKFEMRKLDGGKCGLYRVG